MKQYFQILFMLLVFRADFPVSAETLRSFRFEAEGVRGWNGQPGMAVESVPGAMQLKLTPAAAAGKMAISPPVGLPKLSGKAVLRVSGKIQAEKLQASRLDLKVLLGRPGGQIFSEVALLLPRKTDGMTYFTKAWPIGAEDLSATLYFVCDGNAEGCLMLDDIVLEVLPFSEDAMAEVVPENGQLIYQSEFDKNNSGWSANSAVVKLGKSNSKAMTIDFGEVQPKGKSVFFRNLPLPRLAAGERARLRVEVRSKAVDFKGRRLQLKPLFSAGSQLEFPPPYPELAREKQLETVAGEWTFDSRQTGIQLYLATDGDATGVMEISEVIITVLPSAEAKITTGFENNIVPENNAVISVVPFRPQEVTGGTIELNDEYGRNIRSSLLNGPTEIRLDTPGFYRIRVTARYGEESIVTHGSVAVVGPVLPETLRNRSRYGVVSINAGDGLKHAVSGRWGWFFTGFSGMRKQADETLVMAPEWRYFPVAPESENEIYTVGDLPGFLQPVSAEKNAIWMPTDREEYRRVIRFFADRENFPAYYTVFNEPEGKWRGSWSDFVQWHADTRNAVKSVKPETVVLGPAFCNVNLHLLRKLGALGLFEAVDGLNIHPYVEGTAPEREFIGRIDELEQYLDSIGKQKMPLFYTEFGWTTNIGGWQKPVSENVQKQYVARSLALMGTTRMTGCVYFTLFYRNINPGEEGFSLIDPRGFPRPGAAALATAFRHLGGVTGRGVRLAFSPEIYLCVFDAGNDEIMATVWSTEKQQKFPVPFPVERIYDVVGRPQIVPAGNVLEIGPDLLYLYGKKSSGMLDIHFLPEQKLLTGNQLEHHLEQPLVFPPLSEKDGFLFCDSENVTGRFLVLGRQNGRWVGCPVKIPGALELSDLRLIWQSGEAPEVQFSCRSNLDASVEITIHGELNGCQLAGEPQTAVPDESIPGRLTIPEHIAANGGTLKLFVESATQRRSAVETLDIALLAALRQSGETVDWSSVPVFSWNKFPGFTEKENEVAAFDANECSGTLQTTYSPVGLCFRVVIRDDQHCNDKSESEIWQQDSLQFAFDPDSAKPWEPNAQFGLNGHRVLEYAVSSGKDKKITVWRHTSYDPLLLDNVSEERVQVNFSREQGCSIYELIFPWECLGLNTMPAPGSEIGFSALLNDVDPEPAPGAPRGRHGLRIFKGIHPDKTPEKYGKLYLR